MDKEKIKSIMKAMIETNNLYQKKMGELYNLFEKEMKK